MKTLLLCLFLVGCSTQPQIQRVEIPVTIKCISVDEVPAIPQQFKVEQQMTIFEKVRGVLIERDQLRIYASNSQALLTGCAK